MDQGKLDNISFCVLLAFLLSNKSLQYFAQVIGDGVVLIQATFHGFLHGLLDCWIELRRISWKLLTMKLVDVASCGSPFSCVDALACLSLIV